MGDRIALCNSEACSRHSNIIKIVHSCDYSIVVVLSYLKMKHRDSAPHTPRVILLGPTGCGKSVQAELLASKYGLINGKRNIATLTAFVTFCWI